ncbi:class I SAM-dependent methyltransferase [Dolichospermum sp. LEGE 00240]|uniref:class I SAM-dependent methyltransferase n=1 Tax=Dolichospermum sp. LEGE 00240 TaxID=1828603 RepID=UPI00187FD71F|nr:class I SAM-dependent methyltransferase [Dolichospermum sp. LEGE 00240]MDM3848338.1 class I SAM-dependent methyltransferase [Aphanizomenon gracile PMC638.10]MDM3849122.1 class I SAM-dependent methyltransferase [Aphanizomenon gracile PMC627.10]MDM3857706.1 class I SAM-dependent methyltransferase [Aphanizomenon gracile PMC649.10]MDM3862942.1 class I SAM-dependent methyltransferase [Aphanizomenon gracile PMC644.10]MBE9250536.1 class I SAM-dependent methyltransferase [Dolichospermum sp. LEGE 00
MASNYDSIAKEYKESKELPIRLHIEAYTYFNMLGNLAGKSILDLACGEGFYSRKFKDQGAAKVVGVDISQKIIELAREEETRKFQNIEYILGDVLELGEIGSFDLVVASYLLNYARSPEELLKMCESIFANLKPGGRFVTINNNPSQAPISYLKTEKYGFIKSIDSPLIEGTPIKYTFINNHKFTFDNYYLSIPTHEWAFQSVGFKEVRWQSPIVSPDGIKEFGQEFWQDFLDSVPIIGIECFK